MPSYTWDDDALRSYLLRADGLFWLGADEAEPQRAECIREMGRIVPGLRRRLFERTGLITSDRGLAMLASVAIERGNDARKYWVVASTTPWEHLEEWIADDLFAIYKRADKRRKKDKKTLDGIAAASSRRELE